MNFKPLQDWAVIKRSEAAEKTAGGIIIPESAKEKPLEGIVVAIGPGRFKLEKGKEKEKKKKFIPTVLKPGQRVIYQKFAEREIELGSEVIILVREEDILGTIEDYAITEKKAHALEEKREGSVAVREKAHVPVSIPPKVSEEKPSAAEKAVRAKKQTAEKTAKEAPPAKKEKPAGKKEVTKKAVSKKKEKKALAKTQKTTKKAAKKPAASKKKAQPAVKKSVAAKKTAEKTALKKTAVKKTAPKKAAKAAPKKAAGKKASAKKSVKKPLARGRKK